MVNGYRTLIITKKTDIYSIVVREGEIEIISLIPHLRGIINMMICQKLSNTLRQIPFLSFPTRLASVKYVKRKESRKF